MSVQKLHTPPAQLARSAELYHESSQRLPGGVSSNFRLNEKPAPLFFESASGARLRSVDGVDYLDYALGMGPVILGHAHPEVNAAVADSLSRGQLYAGQHEGELTLARMVSNVVPCAERVRFSLSGSEAIQAALRVARAFTGRPLIVKFEGHYHGWFDNIYSGIRAAETVGPEGEPSPETGGQMPAPLSDLLVLPWNDFEAVARVARRRAGEIAALIMEPILCNTAVIFPSAGYLEAVRDLCTEHGILLIFDEVITGFRASRSGAQGLLGITPDLAVFAKAFANGFPGSCVAGRADVMELFGSGKVLHGGTYNTNTVSTSASIATLQQLAKEDGGVYWRINQLGTSLMEGLRAAAVKAGVPMLVQGIGPVFHTAFTTAPAITDYRSWLQHADQNRLAEFIEALLGHGIRITRRGTWFLSAAHTEADIDLTVAAAERALAGIAAS